ncbi:hypothetical protein CDD83_6648 [Cordyceps sp. RAO-2017]|nr:hypothetical protein CDD83_6648 [Cordyceps sp. RAO-2017]
MSTRQLRKLQQQRELGKAVGSAARDSEGSEDHDDTDVQTRPRPNLFAALGGGDEDVGQDGEDEDEDEEGGAVQPDVNETQSKGDGQKAKKKKKKKRKKAKASGETPLDGDGNGQHGLGEDEIDKAIKELKPHPHGSGVSASHDADVGLRSRMSELLAINTYHLRAANEMRNLFGREVIESASAEEQQETNRRRRAPAQRQVDLETFLREPPGAPKLSEVSLRRNIFVQGRDHWPRQSVAGLTMQEIQKAPDGSWTEYAYVHDKEYDRVQAMFFACVQVGDPMRMVHLLKAFPYHVSTLLQVSSVAKQDQNLALAAELCERALFTFGRVTTSSFRQAVEQGRARLDFRRPENRQFWLAGYHYLKSLVRKGTYRTALEWAKLLYSLDPRDPYAMRHYIHGLAVRAYESRWLIQFLDEIDRVSENRDIIYLRQTLVLAKLQIGDIDGARSDLEGGLQRLPWLYCSMFQELDLDAPPSIWGFSPGSDARSFWVKLYLHQTKDLWNNAQATGLLRDAAKAVDRVDVTGLPNDDPPADLGATRLAFLEGQTSLLAAAPRDLLDSQPNYEFDPLPPAEEDNIFTGEGARLPWRGRREQNEGQDPEMLAHVQNLIAQHVGLPGAFAGDDDDDDDDDDEVRALRQADDEELQRDLDAHMGQSFEPGLLAALLQMLGLGRDEGGDRGDELDQGGEGEQESPEGGPPGAWPAGQEGDDH